MTGHGSALRMVTELGVERLCLRCDEWWPEASEFWSIQHFPAGRLAYSRGRPYYRKREHTAYTCRACRREKQAIAARAKRRAA